MEFSFGGRAILIHSDYPTCEGSENRKRQLLHALINNSILLTLNNIHLYELKQIAKIFQLPVHYFENN